jgi:hypothetical protein
MGGIFVVDVMSKGREEGRLLGRDGWSGRVWSFEIWAARLDIVIIMGDNCLVTAFKMSHKLHWRPALKRVNI